ADLDDVLSGDLGQSYFLDRVGLAEMEARWVGPDGLAEQQDDTELVRIDAEGESVEGDDGRDRHGDQEQEGTRGDRAGRHHPLELLLAALEQGFEVVMLG